MRTVNEMWSHHIKAAFLYFDLCAEDCKRFFMAIIFLLFSSWSTFVALRQYDCVCIYVLCSHVFVSVLMPVFTISHTHTVLPKRIKWELEREWKAAKKKAESFDAEKKCCVFDMRACPAVTVSRFIVSTFFEISYWCLCCGLCTVYSFLFVIHFFVIVIIIATLSSLSFYVQCVRDWRVRFPLCFSCFFHSIE